MLLTAVLRLQHLLMAHLSPPSSQQRNVNLECDQIRKEVHKHT